MGGRLQVRSPINTQPGSEEGVGSCFYFSIDVTLVSASITNQRYTQKTGSDSRNEEGRITFPPPEIVDNLLRLIRGGYIDAIQEQGKALSSMESGKYHMFAQRVMLLAEDFQLDQLETFIAGSRKAPPVG